MAFPTSPILDNFNRANENPMTGWTNLQNGVGVVSNVAQGDTALDYCVATWNTSYGIDQEIYTTISTVGLVSEQLSLYTRFDSGNGNWYELILTKVAGTDTIDIGRGDAFATTVILTVNQEVSAGDSIGMTSIGGTHTIWYKSSGGSWTSLGSVSDSTYLQTGSVGVNLYGVVMAIDNFGGGTVKIVSANHQSITSNLPTSIRKVAKLPSVQTITSNLPTSIRKVTKLPSVQTITSNLPTPKKKVTVLVNALTITSNLPTVSTGSPNKKVQVNALTIQSAVTTPTPKVNIFPSAQTILSNLASPSAVVKKLSSALSATFNLPTVTDKVTVLPNAQTINANQPTSTTTGASSKTFIAQALTITSNFPTPSISINNGLTVAVSALTITSSLQTVSKGITKLPAGMTIASAMGGVTQKVATDVSALQIIASLPSVTISGSSSSRTVSVNALTISSVLGNATSRISYKQIPITSKHQQPRYVNRINPSYRTTRLNLVRSVADHVNRDTLDYVAVNYLLDPDGNILLDPDGNALLAGDGT